ncbi:hypothetical protein M514_28051, partial [Trichuris suis]
MTTVSSVLRAVLVFDVGLKLKQYFVDMGCLPKPIWSQQMNISSINPFRVGTLQAVSHLQLAIGSMPMLHRDPLVMPFVVNSSSYPFYSLIKLKADWASSSQLDEACLLSDEFVFI